jgi:hypothetical protein
MKVKVIIMTDEDWCGGASYAEALEKLDRYVNEDYYRELEENKGKHTDFFVYEKKEVVPKVMILTDDPDAFINDNGDVCTKGGCWTLQVPLAVKRDVVANYRFDIMQRLKDEDFKKEVDNWITKTYGAEFHEFCAKQIEGRHCGDSTHDRKCPCIGSDPDKEGCLMWWYEHIKKPELEKEEG